MYNTLGIVFLALFLAAGCGGRTNIAVVDAVTETEPDSASNQISPDGVLVGLLAGATFVSVEPLNSDGTAISTPPTTNRTLNFTTNAVTHNDIDGTEVGTFSNIDGFDWVANFGSGSVNFSGGNNSILWDGINYQRVATSQFDSRQSLISYLDGTTYTTLGQFDIGENAFGGLELGQWSVQFVDNQVVWSVQDTVSVGTYSFIDGSSFNIDAPFSEITAYILKNDQLVIDSIVYQKEASNELDSQQTLTAFNDE